MTKNLQVIKRRIKTTQNLWQIAKAMEMIAASKIKDAKKTVENNRPYSGRITGLVEKLIASLDTDSFRHPYLLRNKSARKLLVAFAPDRGLCGALLNNINTKLLQFGSKDTDLITVGTKIEKFAVKANFKLAASFPAGSSTPKYSAIYNIIDLINEYYMNHRVSEVHILYTEFKSFFSQAQVIRKILPITAEKQKTGTVFPYIFEPGQVEILNELLPYYLETKIFNFIMNAYASEQAARMVAMKNAKENALEVGDALTLEYNKLRQEKITNEILDIVNGQIQ